MSHPTIPVLHLHCLPRGVRVIHQRFQSRQRPPSGDGPFVWSDEAVLVDTVEHLNVSDDMHWPAHLAQCPQQFNAAKLSATTTIVRLGNHRRTCLVWPNPSAACVDDFAVRGSVVKGLRRLETVTQTRCAQESAPEASDSTTADHWL